MGRNSLILGLLKGEEILQQQQRSVEVQQYGDKVFTPEFKAYGRSPRDWDASSPTFPKRLFRRGGELLLQRFPKGRVPGTKTLESLWKRCVSLQPSKEGALGIYRRLYL